MNRWVLAGCAVLAIWILAAVLKSPILLLAALPLGWFVLYLTNRPPRETRIYHWKNLREPLNIVLIGGVIGLHALIQIGLEFGLGIPWEDLGLLVHLAVFGCVTPTHIITFVLSILDKPPKPTKAKPPKNYSKGLKPFAKSRKSKWI